MTITLELPQEVERELSAEADRWGMSLPEYIERLLTVGRPASKAVVTGASLVSYWRSEDVIGSRSDIDDGRERARHLRSRAERRARQ
ncbi:hypothetical protein BH23ACT11_BH23ACT11_16290 [soil metagenome]